ncbi:MAG TPA: rhomboid family intramembrane serine protease [Acidimicrobiales bacterium]|nr:rhomboid family intramembrane serine protease [Acidimicrobiales bacterium]
MSIPEQTVAPHCYAHPDRVAGSVCRRCGRPICPECMREAPVGWQCSACVREGARRSPVIRWRPSRGTGRLGNTRITPVVVALIVVNIVAYLYEQRHLTGDFERKYFLVPVLVHSHWYSLITSAFLHANGTHILLNMISLAIVGPAVEAEVGPVRFLIVYLLSAVGGSLGFYLLAPEGEFGVGASGAIFGLMGAYFVVARLRGWPTQQIAVLLVINGVYSFSGGIAWQDHLGGLLTGSLVALGLMWAPRKAGRPSEVAELVQGLAVVIASVVALGLLLQIPPGHVNL